MKFHNLYLTKSWIQKAFLQFQMWCPVFKAISQSLTLAYHKSSSKLQVLLYSVRQTSQVHLNQQMVLQKNLIYLQKLLKRRTHFVFHTLVMP